MSVSTLNRTLARQGIASPRASARPALVFVGSPVTFSDRLLEIVDRDFGEVGVRRVHDVAALSTPPAGCRAMIVEDPFCDDLPARLPRYREAAGGAQLVLAYRHAGEARRALEIARRDGALDEIQFLPMHAPLEVWMAALRILMHGVSYVPGELVASAAGDRDPEAAPAPAPPRRPSIADGGAPALTGREMEILALVAEGKPNKTVACEAGLSEHTVKLHMHRIMRKLGVSNRTGAAKWFIAGASRGEGAMVRS